MEEQQTLWSEARRNAGLFSQYYLDEVLLPILKEPAKTSGSAKAADMGFNYLDEKFAILRPIIIQNKDTAGIRSEAQIEDDVIKPILSLVLGHVFDVQVAHKGDRPDYFLFSSEENKRRAIPLDKGTKEFQDLTTGIVDAKAWRKAGKAGKVNGHAEANISQIFRYLINFDKRWGILTDGFRWQLFANKGGIRQDQYLQFDLKKIVDGTSRDDDFRLFLYLFRREAFERGKGTNSVLDDVLDQSIQKAAKLQDDLKQKVYQAFAIVAEEYRRYNRLSLANESEMGALKEASLIFLYRILFLLYGESRLILPVRPKTKNYFTHSLENLLLEQIDRVSRPLPNATRYWFALNELFGLIHGLEGDGSRSRLAEDIDLPAYNGGLFDPGQYPKVAQWQLGDSAIKAVMDLLTKTGEKREDTRPVRVDYRDLGVQHLGNIYEGILENKLVLKDGVIGVETDNGERKATGSYYTPDYIVDYIVEQTLAPVVRESIEAANAGKRKPDASKIEDALLRIKVLDPAMGSGHFLIGAIDYLAIQLAKKGDDEAKYTEAELQECRRKIAERCIYGVDLNPMAVELAKLSIWLHTLSESKPLTFLDNRMKWGNALIGARIADLQSLPSTHVGRASLPDATANQVGLFPDHFLAQDTKLSLADAELYDTPSDEISLVKRKEQLEHLLNERRRPYRQIADFWTSLYFTDVKPADASIIIRELAEVRTAEHPKLAQYADQLAAAKRIADEKRFFHWELEFPEIFFEKDGNHKGENAGWDVVMGNPPYDVISEKEQVREVAGDKSFFMNRPIYQAGVGSKLNLYRLFVLRGAEMIKEGRYGGCIVPMALLADGQAKSLRSFIMSNGWLRRVEAFPQKDKVWDRVFEEAKLSTCIYILRKSVSENCFLRIHPGRDILPTTPTVKISMSLLQSYDLDGLCFPCYPNSTDFDLKLAAKITKHSAGGSAKTYFTSQQGEVNLTSDKRFINNLSSNGSLILRGAHIDRYRFNTTPKQGEALYLDVPRFLESRKKGSKAFDNSKLRIGYQRGSAIDNWKRIIATTIDPPSFCSDTINYIVDPSISLYTVLGLLNSRLWNWRFRLTSSNNHVNSYEIDGLPLRSLNFTTAKKTREKLARQLITLSEQAIGGEKSDEVIRRELELAIQLTQDYSEEKSDVIHDFLSNLAEHMISLNKEKQALANTFFDWMTNNGIKSKAEMKPKTYLDEFWTLDLKDVNKHLTKNAVVLPKIARDYLEEEFAIAKAHILGLNSRIGNTDWLIDQVVYALYGLTEEEIRVVEVV